MIKVRTNPSLALCKYWGKKNIAQNIPATPSIGIGLSSIFSTAILKESKKDEVILNSEYQKKQTKFLRFLKKSFNLENQFFKIDCQNNFPVSSGLASSSSGYASIVLALAEYCKQTENKKLLSSLARQGSGSAARSVYGGWTCFTGESANKIYDADYIDDLSVLICVVSKKQKKVSSKKAMIITKDSSPYYSAWLKNSLVLFEEMKDALKHKDFTKIGEITRLSYARMHSAMLSANPSVFYYEANTIKIISECEKMRNENLEVYETQDAGPQIKILCKDKDIDRIIDRLSMVVTEVDLIKSKIAEDPKISIIT